MATAALLFWPFIALSIFARAAIVPAILAATIVPYLFLPEAFEIALSGVPNLNKTSIISVGIISGLIFFGDRARKKADLPTLKSADRWFRLLLFSLAATVFIGSILTVVNNREILYFGPTVLPAMRAWDVVGLSGDLVLRFFPFFIAYRYISTPDMHRSLLKAIVVAGLLYSILMLVEIRLSPQLHNWIYGFHQHSFGQHIRDGYRPMVFLQHGLWVGFLIFMALIGAVALWKVERDAKWLWAGIWLFIILMVSKNLGAFLLGLLFLSVFFSLWRKAQIQFVLVIALVTVTFPALRQAELVPLRQILNAAESVSEDRMRSLAYRLRNEDQLLQRALQKPLTGWGGWARDRIFDEQGRNLAVSEGRWIQTLGAWGWIGYVGIFGVLALPLLALPRTARRKEIQPQTIALALICVGNLIYMIPNSTLTPISLLCFGALAGFAQFDPEQGRGKSDGDQKHQARPDHRYTRFPAMQRSQQVS